VVVVALQREPDPTRDTPLDATGDTSLDVTTGDAVIGGAERGGWRSGEGIGGAGKALQGRFDGADGRDVGGHGGGKGQRGNRGEAGRAHAKGNPKSDPSQARLWDGKNWFPFEDPAPVLDPGEDGTDPISGTDKDGPASGRADEPASGHFSCSLFVSHTPFLSLSLSLYLSI
jgi:hypothetical protein